MQLQIRHCTEKSNVDDSLIVIDPLQIRHVIVRFGKLSSISGLIDPKSHLNLDYPYHLVKQCIIAEKFEIGSKVEISETKLIFADLNPDCYQHHGKYDYTQNLTNMIDAVKKVRYTKSNTSTTNNNDMMGIDNKI